jgi:hypothetical protein
MPNLDQLAKAVENTENRTPKEVIEAFLPKGKSIGEFPLFEVKYGHCLFLESFDHPLLKGDSSDWSAQDLGVALFTFTRSSQDLFKMVKDGTTEENLYSFLDSIPASKHREYAKEVIFHYYSSMNTIVAMESKGAKAQKKTRSDGFFRGLLQRAVNIIGLRTM